MSNDKPNLPTELINEKTFYTLGGASAGVLLTCWVINYVAADVSWITYKMYRLLGLVLSEVFAFIIVFKGDQQKSMKWLFAVLNGFLIFVNASGLNVMTSSYIFNPKDKAAHASTSYFEFHEFRSDPELQAGIFPLPRMINWWPDEKIINTNTTLASENEKLITDNQKLVKVNQALRDSVFIDEPCNTDSLQNVILELENKLQEVLISNNRKTVQPSSPCKTQIDSLRGQLSYTTLELNRFKQRSLIGLLKPFVDRYQGRTKAAKADPAEHSLIIQDFYKKANFPEFCKSFDAWYERLLIFESEDGIDVGIPK